jgi:hypothetical protein
MKVTYLGNKKNMISYGVEFDGNNPVDVPEENKHAIEKFKGNRFFHVDCKGNHAAPGYYVYPVKKVMTGLRPTTVKENVKLKAFNSLKDAEIWVKTNGKLDVTHIIRPSDEDILPVPEASGVNKDVDTFGVFKLKGDGKPYSRPAKTFESKKAATTWMEAENLNQDEYIIMGK